jgi:hypothetical protein
MTSPALRRAFRARPGTPYWRHFSDFLDTLEASEAAWKRLIGLFEQDVVPIVSRCHPDVDDDEISSTCLGSAFEVWIPDWRERVRVTERVRCLLAEARHDDAIGELEGHPRFCGRRADEVGRLWQLRRWEDALQLVEGTRSARSHFIARARAEIGESQRKQRRQSRLMTRHCLAVSGVPTTITTSRLTPQIGSARCGVELGIESGKGNNWLISALPPAHLPSQELTDRMRRMLGAIEALGPEHSRVFKLLVEGLSQGSIARVEGRHPAAISRRVRNLVELCRVQLLDS